MRYDPGALPTKLTSPTHGREHPLAQPDMRILQTNRISLRNRKHCFYKTHTMLSCLKPCSSRIFSTLSIRTGR